MKKELRERIYNKYNGRCAYCGTPIPITEMQVDHLQPNWHNLSDEESKQRGIVKGTDNESNLMPSCRMCNYYKGANPLEEFRRRIATTLIPNVTEKFNVRLAQRYGLINIGRWDGNFYFERKQEGVMTHEISNRISNIIDILEEESVKLNNIVKYCKGDLQDTEEVCLKDALSSLGGTIDMLYIVNDS